MSYISTVASTVRIMGCTAVIIQKHGVFSIARVPSETVVGGGGCSFTAAYYEDSRLMVGDGNALATLLMSSGLRL